MAEQVRSRSLLVVDQDIDGVFRLREELESVAPGQFMLVHERTVADACRRLSVQTLDAVLLDLSSSDNRDLYAVEAVLACAEHAPVVVMTLHEDDDAALAAIHAGAQECLVKGEEPPRALARVLRHAIERSRLLQELQEAQAADAYRATHDGLTGLANRALFLDRLELQLTHAARDGTVCAVAFLDVDHFKSVNDRLGHASGDALLRHVASALEAQVRAGDTVARFGGDEFAILLRDVATRDDVPRILAHARTTVEQSLSPAEVGHARVGLSLGWAAFPYDGRTAEELLATADAQMYADKRLRHARTATGKRGRG
jgi:diguanylate cyclase (GGDEF)-like protein